ncbi:MAG: DUF4124 domain-containing protein [Betaproteobacteria bacterium]|nr:DUF4124 domain-containing protein [Betaproteobacteria bacterium]
MKRWLLLASCCVALHAQAEIYKSVDASGNVMYTNYPGKGAKPLHIREATTAETAPHKSTHSASVEHLNIPHIDATTQEKRDSLRRTVIESELKTEQQALNDALLAQKQEAPHAGEQLNNPNYLQRVSKLDEAVKLHLDNVTALNKELAHLKQ